MLVVDSCSERRDPGFIMLTVHLFDSLEKVTSVREDRNRWWSYRATPVTRNEE